VNTRTIAERVLVLLTGVGLWWFLRDDAPPEAGLVDPTSTTTAVGASTTLGDSTSVPATPDGVWKVQPADTVFAGYRVQEQVLADLIERTAVGRTPSISGSIIVQGTRLVKANLEADLSRLASNDSNRDKSMRTSGLETDKFPTAIFELTEPVDLGNEPRVGEPVSAKALGTLTLHGVTKPVTVDLQARWNGTSIDVAGSTSILMADFAITPPSVADFVSVADNGVLELQISFVPG
jgi:polyisoprenoid-binding protein YceI